MTFITKQKIDKNEPELMIHSGVDRAAFSLTTHNKVNETIYMCPCPQKVEIIHIKKKRLQVYCKYIYM